MIKLWLACYSKRVERKGGPSNVEALLVPYFYPEMGDFFRVHDVLTGEPLSPESIPPSLERDPICARGFATLRRLGQEGLTVPLLLGSHSSYEDFSQQREAFASVLAQSTVVGIEADWAGEVGDEGEWTDFTPLITNSPGRREYTTHQLSWMMQQGVLALPCDIDGPSDELRTRLQAMFSGSQAVEGSNESAQAQAALLLAYNCTRQWGMMGQLGYWLALVEQHGALPDQPVVPLMLGTLHKAVADKFDVLGVPTIVAVADQFVSEFGDIFVEVTRSNRISREQLRRLV